MWKAAVRGVLAHKFRLLATSLAIVLGVAFMAGTYVLTDTVKAVFDDLFGNVFEGTDAVVRQPSLLDNDFGEPIRERLPEELSEIVRQAEGVRDVDGQVGPNYAQYVDQDGDEIGNPGQGAPTMGFNWSDVDALNPFDIVEGEPPRGPNEVVTDARTAEDNGFSVGDEVRILTLREPRDFVITGVARFGEADSPAGATVALFDTPTAQELLGEPGMFDAISVVGEEGISQAEVVTSIRTELQDAGLGDLEVVTGDEIAEEQQDQVGEGIGFFQTFLLTFGLVGLLVGAYVIYNVFSIVVAQRGRELALLRALGASRRQVMAAVATEAVILGVFASVLGLLAGIGLATLMKAALTAFGLEIPGGSTVIATRTIVVSLVVGMSVTLLSALVPAIRGSRIPPLAAMRDLAIDRSGHSRVRMILGSLLLAGGIAATLIGSFGGQIALVGLGAPLTFIGVIVLGPAIAPPVSRLLGAPLPAVKGITGHLARENSTRHPRRTAAAATALMIGVGLVGFIVIFAESAKASINDTIEGNIEADFVVSSPGFALLGFSPDLEQQLEENEFVDIATPVRFGNFQIGGDNISTAGVEPTEILEINDLGGFEGSPEGLDEDGLAVSREVTDNEGYSLGDSVEVTWGETGPQLLEVALIYEDNTLVGDYFVGLDAWEANVSDQLDNIVYVTLDSGVSPDEAKPALEDAIAEFPNVEVQDRDEFASTLGESIDQILSLVSVLLGLAVVIAVIGIGITLSLSVFERTRELGLLRAVGMTRSQLRSTIRWESVIVALLGTALGLSISLFFSWVLVKSLEDEGFGVFELPITRIVLVALTAALAGVIAAWIPSVRAARMDVLEAIYDE